MKDNQNIDISILVEECINGNREAMSTLYTRYAPRMLTLIQRYVDDLNDAQDILHDGFIVAFTSLGSLRTPERLEYWLATIMRNLSLKFLKSRDLALILHELPDMEDQKVVEDILDFDVLVSMVNTLPDGYQSVFRLAVFENKSHKEISKILGIAPNSSSSQLFRAKLQLRQLINNYKSRIGILSLLLLAAIPGAIFIMRHQDKPSGGKEGLAQDSPVKNISSPRLINSESPILARSAKKSGGSPKSSSKNSFADPSRLTEGNRVDSLVNDITGEKKEEAFAPDQIDANKVDKANKLDNDSTAFYEEYWNLYAALEEPLPKRTEQETNEWSFSLALSSGDFNLGNNGNNDLAYSPSVPGNPGSSGNNGGNSGANGEHPAGDVGFDSNDPDTSDNEEKDGENDRKELYARGRAAAIPLKDQPHHNHLPISFALTAQKRFTPWLGVETGITYTYLHTTFDDAPRMTQGYWHYIGVPLKLNLSMYSASRIRIYGSLGMSFNYPMNSHTVTKAGSAVISSESFKSYPVWSFGGGIGISFNLSRRVDLYLEPSVQYRLQQRYEVPNLWTDERWGLSLPIGIRFKW